MCDGLWLESVTRSTCDGKPFEGLLVGYDPYRNVYRGVWTSSLDAAPGAAEWQGRYDAATETWTWQGATPQGPMRSVLKIDSMSPVWMASRGAYDDDRQELAMVGRGVDTAGQPMTFRQRLIRAGADARRAEMEFQTGDRTSTMTIRYRRSR